MNKQHIEIVTSVNDETKIDTQYFSQDIAQLKNLLPPLLELSTDEFNMSLPSCTYDEELKPILEELDYLEEKQKFYTSLVFSHKKLKEHECKNMDIINESSLRWQDKKFIVTMKQERQKQINLILITLKKSYLTKQFSIASEKWEDLDTFVKPALLLEAIKSEFLFDKRVYERIETKETIIGYNQSVKEDGLSDFEKWEAKIKELEFNNKEHHDFLLAYYSRKIKNEDWKAIEAKLNKTNNTVRTYCSKGKEIAQHYNLKIIADN